MKKICPLINGDCLEYGCEFYIHLQGMNPQTGQPTDEYGCTFRWLPVLLVEGANQTRQATASIDKTATQINKLRGEFIGALPDPAKARLVASRPEILPEKPENGP